MIVDRLKNYKNYAIRNDRLDKAFGFLIKNAAGKLPEGRYDIEGDKIYALVQKYVTEPADEKNWEAHVRHIDLQYMAGGQEVIQWAELEDVAVCAPYNDDNDYALFEGVERTSVKMEEGFFAVFFPQDVHKPGCIQDKPQAVQKIVIKIRLED